MLIGLICIILLFVLARYVVARFGGSRQLALGMGALVSLAFVGGFIERAAFYPVSDVINPSPPTAAVPPTNAASATLLTTAQLQTFTTSSPSQVFGHIDNISGDGTATGTLSFAQPRTVFIDGWAADPTTNTPGQTLIAIIDHRTRVDITPFYHTPRPDVVKAFRLTSMQLTGIVHAPLAVNTLPPGPHTIEVGVIGANQRKIYVVQPAVTITIVK